MSMALEGIRVLEWGHWHQGPLAARILGDLGAEVIKIEERVRGDPMRGLARIMGAGTGFYGRNCIFELHNRNKKSITLDLTKERGKPFFSAYIPPALRSLHDLLNGLSDKQLSPLKSFLDSLPELPPQTG